MSKPLLAVALLLVLGSVAAASYWAGTRKADPPKAAGAPGAAPSKGPAGIAVEAAAVATVKLPNALAAVGSLRSDETIVVRPEIAGRVAQISFQEGERVAKGRLLLTLDDSVQKADIDRARANLTLQQSKFDRAVEMRKQGFISSQARDEAENNLKVTQADVESMQARLDKMQIRAPFSGTIGLRAVSVGDYVKEGQDIVNLEAIDSLKVDFRVPEVFISQVKNGQSLQITLDAIPDKTYTGRVSAINPLIDANGRSIVLRAVVPNVDGLLRPGMFARVRLFTNELKDTFVIPEESLFPVGNDKFVYRIVDDRAQRQKVEIGQRRDGKVEILAGVGAGDTVVTAGHQKLRDGTVVRVANAPAPAVPIGKAESPAPAKGS